MKQKPTIALEESNNVFGTVKITHEQSGDYYLYFENPSRVMFTENETNVERLYGQPNPSPFVKDAFNKSVIEKDFGWLDSKKEGTKFAPFYEFNIPAHSSVSV